MAALADTLTISEFQRKYPGSDTSHEYWFGKARPKGMPTWIHGLLQGIIIQLLADAGFAAGAEVELRIDPHSLPKPDVIATTGNIETPYPTTAVDVVIEILSDDDPMPYMLEKCQAYHRWGFKEIYVLNAASRQLFRWTGSALEVSERLTAIPVNAIWQRLDAALNRK